MYQGLIWKVKKSKRCPITLWDSRVGNLEGEVAFSYGRSLDRQQRLVSGSTACIEHFLNKQVKMIKSRTLRLSRTSHPRQHMIKGVLVCQ